MPAASCCPTSLGEGRHVYDTDQLRASWNLKHSLGVPPAIWYHELVVVPRVNVKRIPDDRLGQNRCRYFSDHSADLIQLCQCGERVVVSKAYGNLIYEFSR